MKKLALAASAVAIFALGSGAALAGEDWEAKLEERFAAADTDGDGVVTEAEFLARTEAKAKEAYAKLSGGDGALTLEEAKAAYKAEMEAHKKKAQES